MRNNKIFKAIAISAPVVLLSTAVYAATETPVFEFTTVADVVITPVSVVNFGASIIPISGNVCTLTPVITTGASDSTSATIAAATIAGTGCNDAATDGKEGVFDITGAADASVTITLTESDAAVTDYDFEPTANYYPNATATALTTGVSTTVALDAAGLGMLVVGGVLTLNADLTYATDYDTTTYSIEITY